MSTDTSACGRPDRPSRSDLLLLMRDLTDALSEGFDVADVADLLVRGCIEHTGATEAGIMIADNEGRLRILATSDSGARSLELYELVSDSGPCIDAFRQGARVSSYDLSSDVERWPSFAPAAVEAGITEAHALPIRLRESVVGALNLFVTAGSPLQSDDIELVETLAGAAALGILTHHRFGEQQLLADRLQGALDSRIVIEQAKGVISARTGASVNEAFTVLRGQARHERRPLREVAGEIVARTRPVPTWSPRQESAPPGAVGE